MKKVIVIGAGFSGMASAYFLSKKGYEVEVFERQRAPGGLIRTIQTEWGPCETAANGILNSKIFEELALDVGIRLRGTQALSKRRYIFRGGLKRWPLTIFETLAMSLKFIFSTKRPREEETVQNWGQRVLGEPATRYLLSPVLQGIYAGDISKMSASLILKRFFNKQKKAKPKIRGLVSPEGGMEEFFTKTEKYLKGRGVKFFYGESSNLETDQNKSIYVLATSSKDAAEILKSRDSELGGALGSVENLSLVKVTAFFKNTLREIKGFGVLFPRDQKVSALGVLFNNFIFDGAKHLLSESFIYGGALENEAAKFEEAAILRKIKEDRAKVYGGQTNIEGFHLIRWPTTLPHYTVQLEKKLRNVLPHLDKLEKEGIFVIGNFLGGIGLSQLLERAAELPRRIGELHG